MRWAGLVAIAFGGCGSDPVKDPCADDPDLVDCSHAHDVPASLEVGIGDPESSSFEPLPPDGQVPLVAGVDGGYHLWLQVRTSGLCPNTVVVDRRIGDPLLRYQATFARLVPTDEGAWTLASAAWTFLCPSNTPGVQLHDVQLALEVTLSEVEGECPLPAGTRTISETVTIVPTCPDGDTICSDDWEIGCAAPP